MRSSANNEIVGKAIWDHLIPADEVQQVQQVFWNLINNSVKFTPEGGRIRHPHLESAPGLDPHRGRGQRRRHRTRFAGTVFEAFQQVERSVTREYGGLGLGLAICRALVTMHSGSVRAKSEGWGTGATFTVELPLLANGSPASGREAAANLSGKPGTGRLRVLLVEDHTDTARVMQHLLHLEGHEVAVAETIASALDAAKSGPFDLVISDLGLPDGSGLDLLRQLRAMPPRLRAIALSGYGMDEDLQRSRDAGFDEHLTKPVDFARLHATIAGVMSGDGSAACVPDATA